MMNAQIPEHSQRAFGRQADSGRDVPQDRTDIVNRNRVLNRFVAKVSAESGQLKSLAADNLRIKWQHWPAGGGARRQSRAAD